MKTDGEEAEASEVSGDAVQASEVLGEADQAKVELAGEDFGGSGFESQPGAAVVWYAGSGKGQIGRSVEQ